MKREIKFRAWNDAMGQMQYDPNVGTMKEMSFVSINDAIAAWPSHLLMQYTGLKDKNGVEIYEGDILCIDNEEVAETIGGYPRYEPDNIISDVYYHYGSFRTKAGDFNLMADEYGESEKAWEIIGNIYENEELLNSKEV